ncbi:MAG: alkaline phosphatase family protein, partial [Planctomycetes bacterium]|nr:alkaline phosphatase family protein [Planctomycetota bacterium]
MIGLRSPKMMSYKDSNGKCDKSSSSARMWPCVCGIVIFVILLSPASAEAYIGPGAGFAIGGSVLVIFTSIFAGVFALLTWPVRWLFRFLRGRKAYTRSRIKRFIVLGMDGMDPVLTERFIAEGRLPNLARMRERGCFKPLTTTIPPISPVAWSSFQTGSNPGKHNIFDFLTINPKTYQPKLSSTDIRGPSRMIRIGKYIIPIGRANIRLLRKGKPFWHILAKHGIFSNILRVPITFPPQKYRGLLLSAMCVPDIRGTQGTFSFYTTRADNDRIHTGGERFCVKSNGRTISAELIGPENPLRADRSVLKCSFTIRLSDSSQEGQLRINGERHTLVRDKYSDWIPVVFKAGPLVRVYGICRFLLLGVKPEFELYVSPINIDPEKPAMPISHPRVYSTYLAKQQGKFATLGLAEDTWALNEGILSDEAFVEQSVSMDTERQEMFFDALAKLKRGVCVCVFDGTDRIQHAFWRYHEKRDAATARLTLTTNPVEDVYRRADDIVGKVMAKYDDKDTVIMVISDHGFKAFRYGLDLNRWLEEKGYLVRKTDAHKYSNLEAVDFSKTKAFAVGLSGIFLNLKGRMGQG